LLRYYENLVFVMLVAIMPRFIETLNGIKSPQNTCYMNQSTKARKLKCLMVFAIKKPLKSGY